MSDEPIAKRTRLSVSRCQNERYCRYKEMRTKCKELYESGLSDYKRESHKLSQLADRLIISRKGLMLTQKCVGICDNKPICDCKKQQFALEHLYKKAYDHLKVYQRLTWNISHVFESTYYIACLHPHNCTESDECLLEMQRMLINDPLSLERKQFVFALKELTMENIKCRQSPLHHAIGKGHVKCVKFLLKNGANVTSLTTEDCTIFDSLYNALSDIGDMDEERLVILKLLLQYGASSMFKRSIYAGEWALRSSIEEISLLLQHGAILSLKTSRSALFEAWESFNLPVVKLLLLHHRNRLNFGPGSNVLCPISIRRCYNTMVFPGVPSEEYHEKLLEALQLYKTFGGKFPVCPTKDPNRDLMQYLKSYKHKRHFDGVKSRIKALVSNPLSLQEISRLAVRKCIRKNYVENIKELEVPQTLQSFLRFDDVVITKLPEEFDKYCYNDASSGGSEDEDME